MPQYIGENEGSFNDNPRFQLVLIQSVEPEKAYQGAQYFFTLKCRVNQAITINKSIWYRTADEVVNGNEYKKDTWKIKRLFQQANVPPKETVDTDGQKASLYDEMDLEGATLKALTYRNPESGYLEIFEFVSENADELAEATVFNRFNKFYTRKFGSVSATVKEEPERVKAQPAQEQPVNSVTTPTDEEEVGF